MVVITVVVAAILNDTPLLPLAFHMSSHFLTPWMVPLGVLVWLIGVNVARTLRRSAGARRQRAHPGVIWCRDRDWPADGVERRIASGIHGTSTPLAAAVVATTSYCAAVLAYCSRPGSHYASKNLFDWVPAPGTVVVATYALPLVWLLLVLVPRLGRGRLVVSWPTFPQFTGRCCAFHVGTSPGGARIDGVRVFLRCIRVRNRPFLPLVTWNSRLAWVAEARLPLAAYVGPESDVRVEFDVPPEAPSTDLHAADAVRWELLVLGTVGATDYADCVDVPVYGAST